MDLNIIGVGDTYELFKQNLLDDWKGWFLALNDPLFPYITDIFGNKGTPAGSERGQQCTKRWSLG